MVGIVPKLHVPLHRPRGSRETRSDARSDASRGRGHFRLALCRFCRSSSESSESASSSPARNFPIDLTQDGSLTKNASLVPSPAVTPGSSIRLCSIPGGKMAGSCAKYLESSPATAVFCPGKQVLQAEGIQKCPRKNKIARRSSYACHSSYAAPCRQVLRKLTAGCKRLHEKPKRASRD